MTFIKNLLKSIWIAKLYEKKLFVYITLILSSFEKLIYLYESGVARYQRAIRSCFFAEMGFLPLLKDVSINDGPIRFNIISKVSGYILKLLTTLM